MRTSQVLSEELILILKQGWIGDTPKSQAALSKRLQELKLLTTPEVFSAFSSTDRVHFTPDPDPYSNLSHNIGGGEKMTIPTMHAVTLQTLFPVLGAKCRKVLDIGCGAGYLTHCLAKLAPSSQVLGIDINQQAITRALSIPKIPPNVTIRRADVKEIIDDEFDAIHIGFNVPTQLCEEFSSKLKSGGLMWAPVISDTCVWVSLIDNEGKMRKVIDMEYSPLRQPVTEFQDNLKEIEGKIKQLYEDLQKQLGRPLSLKDFPPSLQPLLRERKTLMNKIKKFSA